MLQEAAEMGFEYVELGHSTTVTSIDGILKAVGEGVVKVSSLHNFCPIPPFAKGASPNLFSPSTKHEAESSQWLRHTRNTLSFAKEFHAKAVVCHCGELSYFFRRQDRHVGALLEKYGYEKLSEAKDYDKLLEKFKLVAKKDAEKKDYKNIEKNIALINESAKDGQILLGLENRESYSELPLDWDIKAFFATLKECTQARFWHDVGHSKRKELARADTQLALAERTCDIVCGWHLHDCSAEGKDHIAIGKGCVDFKAISKYFNPKEHIFTLELNRNVAKYDAIESLKRVQDMM